MPFSPSFLRSAFLVSALALLPATPIRAEGNTLGAYLAARLATSQSDYQAARDYYDRLLLSDPTDASYQEGSLITHVALGDYDRAKVIADAITSQPKGSQFGVLVELAADARAGDFEKGIKLLDAGGTAGDLVSGIYRAWALVAEGRMADAGKAFDTVAKTQQLAIFAVYHKALALAMVGDYEGADAIFAGKYADPLHGSRRGVLAHVEILSQLERDPDALALFDRGFGQTLDPELAAIRAKLVKGEMLPFNIAPNAAAGVAELYLAVAQALNTPQSGVIALLHARLAVWIRPDLGDAQIMTASLLEREDQHDLAIEAYAAIPADSPVYPAAQLGRAEALVVAGQRDAAVDILQDLTRKRPDLYAGWVALGDTLRRADKYQDAVAAYDKAIALVSDPGPGDWFPYFARGMSRSKLGDWPGTEADMRMALKLSPEQATVLNFLGYSYVEKRQNLDEALDMIKRAVAANPEQGYIVDSLGWAYFQLGRYNDAVTEMERAISLEPNEPLLNDHLGDVYWAVGRRREAEFQWRRALNLGPGPEDDLDEARVRRKLEVGLDQVLKDEGAPALLPVPPAPAVSAPAAAPEPHPAQNSHPTKPAPAKK